MNPKPIILALTGASGAIYGVEILKALHSLNQNVHLIVSEKAKLTIKHELEINPKDLYSLATKVHENNNIGASIASGSFLRKGMIVAPCSVKTLSSIANSYNNNLITRSADVCLKERKKLILLFRESPFHLGHINLMQKATELGAIIAPPLPAFYTKPKTIEDIIKPSVAKALDLLEIENNISNRWQGDI